MQPPQVQARRGDGLQNRPFRIPGLDGKTELGIDDARSGISVGMRVNARRHPHQNILRPARLGADVIQQLQLVKAVHHDAPDAGGHGLRQLRRRLVVPVKIHLVQGRAAGDGHGQFPAGYHIQPQPFRGENPRQRRVDVRLGGIHRLRIGVAVGESAGELPAARPQRGLVQRIQRRAVLLRQLQGVAAADGQVAGGVGGGGIGQDVGQAGEQHNDRTLR